MLSEVVLPERWNRRLFMFGNGGYAGDKLDAPPRLAARNQALGLGFVVTQTNTGHHAERQPLASFAVESEKLKDFAFRAVHLTVVVAKQIAQAYYREKPRRAYFQGCSTGGRQGLIAAQRFPGDFDGIIAGAPSIDEVADYMKRAAIVKSTMSEPIATSKLNLLAGIIYARCDHLDGIRDGLISDPLRCRLDPTRDLPSCTASSTADCFTDSEIRTLTSIYGNLTFNGQKIYPGWPFGGEIAGRNGRSGWLGTMLTDGSETTISQHAQSFFRYFVFKGTASDLRLKDVDLSRPLPGLDALRTALNATDPDLAPFRKRGGKLIVWFGWADPIVNPTRAVEYYEAVLGRMGSATRDFFRLYMLPGVFHCGGGPGCDAFPRLATLIEWVERRIAPDNVVASCTQGDKVIRTRPLCSYPDVVTYRGSGSPDQVDNYACVPPNSR
jgi:feruloyl esterase